MNALKLWLGSYVKLFMNSVSGITFTNVVEILILAGRCHYNVFALDKKYKSVDAFKGNSRFGAFVFVVYVLRMDTLIFIVQRGIDIAIIAALVIFQPELPGARLSSLERNRSYHRSYRSLIRGVRCQSGSVTRR